ncbi:unnamed protein product [Rotaria sp. Silwood2]|nr:unnamed protein product [Rotaria sp. Silwood2]CAF3935761.1 unnamed protein product [Rotaria sp. Silwood2]CAF4035156.1 unnamed protein product [Rotaria sp. Silwood2]
MARVMTNNNGNTSLPTTTPFMDRLSHSVIKETSKSLRYYIDVKRRENAFVLNPNSSVSSSIPLKARFMYGTAKEYPPLYGSYHSDNDLKVYLRCFQKQQKQLHSLSSSPEKQLCRDELNFHMRTYKYSPRENQQFAELRLRPTVRSSSSCSGTSSLEFQKRASKSASKRSHHEQNQLIDNTANILASMIKTRRSIYEKYLLSEQTPAVYESRNANPSPRQTDDQSNVQTVPLTLTDASTNVRLSTAVQHPKKSKRRTANTLEKASSIMRKAKLCTKGILCDYKVSVITGNCNGASTSAPIRIKFYGTNGYTDFVDLNNSETHRVPFLKDQTDVFTVQTCHVGQLVGITIGHDQKDMRSGWFLNKVSINDPIRKLTYNISCNAWLSNKSNDQKTMRDFQVTSMVSHKEHIDTNEHQEEMNNLSDYSTTTTEDTIASNVTSPNQNDQLIDNKHTKKHRKQQHVSIDRTTTAKTQSSLTTITNHHSQSRTTTKINSNFNRDEPSSPPAPARRSRSPILSRTPPTNSEDEVNLANHSRSTTPTSPSVRDQSRLKPIFDRNTTPRTDETTNDILKHHSTDHDRPPARLEKRSPPSSISPERPIKSNEQANENDVYGFFE